MPLFICAKCGCVENTALSTYWFRKNFKYCDELREYQDKPLCSKCGRVAFEHVNDTGLIVPGCWHGKFPRVRATDEQKRNAGADGRIYTPQK